MDLNLISILMPTVAKVTPEIFKAVKEHLTKKKLTDQNMMMMVILEMEAKQNDHLITVSKVLELHEKSANQRYETMFGVVKTIRDKMEKV